MLSTRIRQPSLAKEQPANEGLRDKLSWKEELHKKHQRRPTRF